MVRHVFKSSCHWSRTSPTGITLVRNSAARLYLPSTEKGVAGGARSIRRTPEKDGVLERSAIVLLAFVCWLADDSVQYVLPLSIRICFLILFLSIILHSIQTILFPS